MSPLKKIKIAGMKVPKRVRAKDLAKILHRVMITNNKSTKVKNIK